MVQIVIEYQKSRHQEQPPEAVPPLTASGMEQWNDGIVPVKSWNSLEAGVTAQFTKPPDCLPLAGMLSRDHSSIQDLRDFFCSTGIAPGKAGNGSASGFVNRSVKLMVIFVLPRVSTPFGHLIYM